MNCKKMKKEKKCFTIIKKKKKNIYIYIQTIYILYIIISLQIFFKELRKYKNDYQQYLNYIYIYIYIYKNYIIHFIVYL